ncbi:glycosyltransferase family 4 protein [Rossellomorea sp. AcN35-11]|nr:glycosyltransferase family 4 protein [Rossellomorea aquimaris]WJV30758.1 glycosyltransferase family 4 protein [Rossellomorea sp. AcN35-11]
MHILIPVFFNAPMGGLHENVFSTAKHCIKNNVEITILCKEGPFQKKLVEIGAHVVTTNFEPSDYKETIKEVISLHNKKKISLIHTHPFASRKISLEISKILGVPVVLTMHGRYFDELPKYINDLSMVFTVSEGIKDHLVNYLNRSVQSPFHHKFFVIPNGVDKQLFSYYQNIPDHKKDRINISLVSRLDKDKEFIINIFYQALTFTSNHYTNKVTWTIVGDGTLKEEMKREVHNITNGQQKVEFVGWKEGTGLRDSYLESDIVLAPGRCALEAMSCRKPVIALGSKGYVGLIDHDNWLNGVYSNFGGIGNKSDDYLEGTVEKDLEVLLTDHKNRENFGKLGEELVGQFYNEEMINDRLLGFYRILSTAERSETGSNKVNMEYNKYLLKSRLEKIDIGKVENTEYKITAICSEASTLKFAWYIFKGNTIIDKFKYTESNSLHYRFEDSGNYKVLCFLLNEEKLKVSVYSDPIKIQ